MARSALQTKFKIFFRTHLDYGDIIYDQPSEKIESVQYNAALAIKGCNKGDTEVKLYHELELEKVISYKKDGCGVIVTIINY